MGTASLASNQGDENESSIDSHFSANELALKSEITKLRAEAAAREAAARAREEAAEKREEKFISMMATLMEKSKPETASAAIPNEIKSVVVSSVQGNETEWSKLGKDEQDIYKAVSDCITKPDGTYMTEKEWKKSISEPMANGKKSVTEIKGVATWTRFASSNEMEVMSLTGRLKAKGNLTE